MPGMTAKLFTQNVSGVINTNFDVEQHSIHEIPVYGFIFFHYQTVVNWKDDKLVCVQRGEKKNRGWTHWIQGDDLHLVD